MSELPPGWEMKKLADVCDKPQYGWTTKANNVNTRGLKLLRTTDITKGPIDWATVPSCTEEPADVTKYQLRQGDLVVSRAGSVGVSTLIDREPPPAVFASYLIRMRPRGVDPRYMKWFMQSSAYWRAIEESAAGIALQNVNAKKLAAIEIPIAPPDEQQRIVEVIEEQFSRLDAGVESLQRAKRKLNRLRVAVLRAAIRGDISIKSSAAPRLSTQLPDGWHWSTVGEVGDVDLGRQRSPRYHSGPHIRPYLRVANVFENRIDLSDVMEMDFPPDQYERYRLEYGDILLNEGQSSELVGRPAMYRDDLPGACFTNSLIRFRPRSGIIGDFALLVFRSYLHSGRFRQEARITTNIAHLSGSRFKAIEFPVPPSEVQKDVVSVVQCQESIFDAMGSAIDAASGRADILRRAILASAFSGRLQHPPFVGTTNTFSLSDRERI